MTENIRKATSDYLKTIKILLRDSKYRDKRSMFVAEGEKIVTDILNKQMPIESVLVSNKYITGHKEIIDGLLKNGIITYSVNNSFFEKISILRNSPGILAEIPMPDHDLTGMLSIKNLDLMLLLDGIQDPGNMGTLIRTAAAFNVDAVLIYGEHVDIYNPKVIRATAGSLLDVPVISIKMQQIQQIKNKGYTFLSADNSDKKSCSIQKIGTDKNKNILVFGSEGKGISKEILGITDKTFHIPINNKIDSLNVASACSIALFYFSDIGYKGG